MVSGPALDVSIELSPLQPATGSVRDEAGHPIAGARVSTLNAAIPPPLGKVSALALRHLGSGWSATTDSSGVWTLPLPKGAVPLLFEAPGRSAEWRVRPEGDFPAIDVSLSPGATLTVTTNREEANLVVTLSRAETSMCTIPVDRQPFLWARSGKNKMLTWSSLPPGTYTIYAKYPEPRYFMQTAAKLADVVLSAGEERGVKVTLPPVRQQATRSARRSKRSAAMRWDGLCRWSSLPKR
jgi:hypothetical protein